MLSPLHSQLHLLLFLNFFLCVHSCLRELAPAERLQFGVKLCSAPNATHLSASCYKRMLSDMSRGNYKRNIDERANLERLQFDFCGNLQYEKQIQCYETSISSLQLSRQVAMRECSSMYIPTVTVGSSSKDGGEDDIFEICVSKLKEKFPRQRFTSKAGKGILSYENVLQFCSRASMTAEIECYMSTFPSSNANDKKMIDALAHSEARKLLCLGCNVPSGPIKCSQNLLQVTTPFLPFKKLILFSTFCFVFPLLLYYLPFPSNFEHYLPSGI